MVRPSMTTTLVILATPGSVAQITPTPGTYRKPQGPILWAGLFLVGTSGQNRMERVSLRQRQTVIRMAFVIRHIFSPQGMWINYLSILGSKW